MMIVRLALEIDEAAVIALGEQDAKESYKHLVYNPEKARKTFSNYLDEAEPTIFVVEGDREVVGFLMASINDYPFADGIFVRQQVIYVRPDKRGTRAAALLVDSLVDWADRLNATEIVAGNDNGLFSERTAKFFKRFGFEQVGFLLKRIRSA